MRNRNRFPFSDLQSLIAVFVRDRRGVTLVTYALVLPLLLMIVFGAATTWRVISVKQSMDVATYEAARYLSHEGERIARRPPYDAEQWRIRALQEIDWVRDEIRRNPFVGEEADIQVEIIPPVDVDCAFPVRNVLNRSRAPENIRFTVITKLSLKSSIQIPFVGSPVTFELQESHNELVECPRFDRDPPDEGEIFFPRRRY